MAKAAPEIPKKLFYKIGEVCEITETQPYVLRFWESEFPQLAPRKNRSGQRVYQRKDIDTVIRIKRLLYEEEYTIAGARRKLEEDPSPNGIDTARVPAPQVAEGKAAPTDEPAPARRARAEHDHPVDLLAARAEKHSVHTVAASVAGDPEREARLEKTLDGMKKQLKEILALLGKE